MLSLAPPWLLPPVMWVLPSPLQLAFPVSTASPAHQPGVVCRHCQRFLSGWLPRSPLLAAALRSSGSSTGFPLPLFHLLWRGLVFSSGALAVLAFLSFFPVLCPPPPKSLPISRVPLVQQFSLSLACNFFFSCAFCFQVMLSIQFTCHTYSDNLHVCFGF